MCDVKHTGIDGIVPGEIVLYRAGSKPTFINLEEEIVNEAAFYKEGKNHTDGLSFGLTPEHAADELKRYNGILSIEAREIRALNLGVEIVYEEPRIPGTPFTHALLRNLPCMDRELEEQGDAIAAAGTLARAAHVFSTIKFRKKN
jgi:hypothetical protein